MHLFNFICFVFRKSFQHSTFTNRCKFCWKKLKYLFWNSISFSKIFFYSIIIFFLFRNDVEWDPWSSWLFQRWRCQLRKWWSTNFWSLSNWDNLRINSIKLSNSFVPEMNRYIRFVGPVRKFLIIKFSLFRLPPCLNQYNY